MAVYGPSQAPASQRVCPWAIGALVCGVLALGFGPLAAVPAVIVGHKALRQIRRTGERGYGLANAGLVLGYVIVAVMALAVAGLAVSQIESAF
jgi:hypothetical protein